MQSHEDMVGSVNGRLTVADLQAAQGDGPDASVLVWKLHEKIALHLWLHLAVDMMHDKD